MWQHSCRKDARQFNKALRNPEAAQAKQLRSILNQAAGSQWAEFYGIDKTTSLQVFRDRVPVQDPSELVQWTDRIIRGEPNVLTSAPVDRLVPTSGTTGLRKLIPMTRGSRGEYSTAINLWIHDCFNESPTILKGRAYIATSPSVDLSDQSSAVPVGFAEDSAYLGPLARSVLNHILAVPMGVSLLRDSAWRTATRNHLLRASNLRFLSLWHPSYLEALFESAELEKLKDCWKHLSLISCWSDGACGPAAQRLMEQFPQARHQAKGLWLTEGPISVPWNGRHPLALLSGFFEFEAEDGSVALANELETGVIYRPVLTNQAGLYRYRLGDLVRVEGRLHQTPCLRWLGRADLVSDLRGEKLSDAHVAEAIVKAGWRHAFRLIAMRDECPPYYLGLVDRPPQTFPIETFENVLRQNPHYDWARTVGQLSAPRIHRVEPCRLEASNAPHGFHLKGSYLGDMNLISNAIATPKDISEQRSL